jgi:hypothetical protein
LHPILDNIIFILSRKDLRYMIIGVS